MTLKQKNLALPHMLNYLHICCRKCLCRVVPGSIRGFNLIAAIVILQPLWVLHQPSSLELVLNPVHLTAFHLSRRRCSQCFFKLFQGNLISVTVYSVWDWPKREATTSAWVIFCNVNLVNQAGSMHSTPLINTQNLYSVRRDVYVLQNTQFL